MGTASLIWLLTHTPALADEPSSAERAATWSTLAPVQVDPTCLGVPPVTPTRQGDGDSQQGRALTKEEIARLPSGRSHQSVLELRSAVQGGAASPSQPLGGRTVTDLVTGTFSNSFHFSKHPTRGRAARSSRPNRQPKTVQRAFPRGTGARAAGARGRQRPAMTWGGTVHLSNDDTMSLASSQRILWALEHSAPIPVEHIRPHELLNYFSFDTAPPEDAASLFAIGASAFRQDDALRLAVDVSAARPARPPVDLTVLVDRSGSMRANDRIGWVRRALTRAIDRLQDGDRFDLVVFDHDVCVPVRDFVVGRDDPGILPQQIDALRVRGSTDLDAGLTEAYRIARAHQKQRRAMGRVMVFTDARLNTGTINRDVVTEVGRAMDRDGIRLTGVGVGNDFRDDVLDQLTEKGRGAYVFLGSEPMVDRLFGPDFDALIHTVAEDVRFWIDLPDSLGMQRYHGEESSRKASKITPVMVGAGSSQVHFADLKIRDGQLQPDDTLTFHVSWTPPDASVQQTMERRWRVSELLTLSPRNAHKAAALMAWSDLLLDRAMGGDPCGPVVRSWAEALDAAGSDGELAWIRALTPMDCPDLDVEEATPGVAALRLRIDADQPISAVDLACPDHRDRQALPSGEQVVLFDRGRGSCQVTLHGAVPLAAALDVAPQGTQVTCRVRGGRMACR